MTLEELKIEADKLGYCLVKKPEKVTLLSCPICGKKRTHEWFSTRDKGKKRVCYNCGFEGGYGKNGIEAKKKWNESVLEYEKEEKNGN